MGKTFTNDLTRFCVDVQKSVGLVASLPIEKGRYILPFDGKVYRDIWMDADFPEARKGRPKVRGYPVQIGPGIVRDARNPIRCINHSCEPNCGLRLRGGVHGFEGLVWVVARRDIRLGEQVTFDYAMSQRRDDFTLDPPGTMCHCHTALCRGVNLGFESLPQAIRNEYVAEDMILPHLLDPECEELEQQRICPPPEQWEMIMKRWR